MASTGSEPRFGRVITAMVTPFDEDGSLDLDAAVTLARWLTDHGSDGLVLAGSTGEGSVLSDEERIALWQAVSESVTVPVIAGSGSNDTAHTVALTKRASKVGVAGVLVVTPYYNRPSQAGLRAHFEAVAGATDLPVILYDIPIRSGRKIATQSLLAMAREVPNIVAVKDAAGSPATSASVVAHAPPGFELYSGDDVQTLPLLAVGAVGVISVASHWVGRQMGQLVSAFRRGDIDGARAANAALLDSFEFESSEEYPNPLPAKAACRAMGLPVGQCRLPMGPSTPDLDERARQLLARLGVADPTGQRVA